jgi:predicted acyltransferase
MTLGLLAGGVLRSDRTPAARVRWLVAAGITGIVTGWLLGVLGICPVVKRIWTPSFTLWSGGICFLLLAGFYQMIDVLGHRRWAFPLLVIGMNSIAAYCLHELFSRFVGEDLVRHLGDGMFGVFGDAYFPFLQGVMVVAALWLVLLWMWKRQIFLRI